MKRRDFLAGAVTGVTSARLVGLARARSCSEGRCRCLIAAAILRQLGPAGSADPSLAANRHLLHRTLMFSKQPPRVRSLVCQAGLALAMLALGRPARPAAIISADLCIYGGTAAGVAAAVQTSRMGRSAVIAEFGQHLGGMTSGGLGATDFGNKAAIGGIAREFYQRVALHYARPDSWPLEDRKQYFDKRAATSSFDDMMKPNGTMWTFEPHVAEAILFQMLNEVNVPVRFGQRFVLVKKDGARITELVMDNG